MKKIKLLFIVGLLSALQLLSAQSAIRINNFLENPYYINPASFNIKYSSVYSVAGRKQWLNFPGAPTTFFFSATTFFPKLDVQVGLKAMQDKIGYTSYSLISASYTYVSLLNDDWHINMGLSGSFQNQYYDMAAVNSETDDPAVFQRLASSSSYDADLGFEIYNHDWRLGASSQNLLTLFSSAERPEVNINYLYSIYRRYNHGYLDYGGAIAVVQSRQVIQPEVRFSVFYKEDKTTDLFQIGLLYRPTNELGAVFGLNLGNNLLVTYSYDYNFGAIYHNSIGSHEVMLIYRVPNCPACKKVILF